MAAEPSTAALSAQPWNGIPRELAERARPHLDQLADEMHEEILLRVAEYGRPHDETTSATARAAVDQVIRYFLDGVDGSEGSGQPVAELFHAIGRAEASKGNSLDTLQAAVRTGGLVAWRRISAKSPQLGLSAQTLCTLAEAIFLFQDEVAAAAAAGYAQAQEAVAGEMQRRRRRLLDLLVAEPPPDPDSVAELARAARWQAPRTVAAVALCERAPDRRRPSFPPDILVDLGRPKPCLIIPDPDGPGRAKLIDQSLHGWVAAMGPTVPLAAAARSLRWADEALGLMHRGVIEDTGVIRCVEHMSTLIVFQDEDLLHSLAAIRLAPLAHLRDSQQDRLAETLLSWLQSGRNANEVAMRLHVHPQTVRYRLRQLEELFGDQLHDPDLRFELEIVLRARNLLAGNIEEIPTPAGPESPTGEVVSLRRLRS